MKTTVRLINPADGKVRKPFEAWVEVEPCAPSFRRYRIGGTEYPWEQVILAEDSARVHYLKWVYIRESLRLYDKLLEAVSRFNKHTGPGRYISLKE